MAKTHDLVLGNVNRYEAQKRKSGEKLLPKIGEGPAMRRFLKYVRS
jgi:hypothetical protein